MTGIHWRHWPGAPHRPAMALHCMMASGAYWGPIAAQLDGRVDLRGFDMPAHGRSGSWEITAGTDFHTTVTRIAAAAIDRPLDLIGHSIGATVALRLAVAAPEAVRSLTLIEPVLFAAAQGDHPDGATVGGPIADLLDRGEAEAAARMFLTRWGAAGGFDALPPPVRSRVVREQIALIVQSDPALSGDSAGILRPGRLEAIDAPVMLISGADSPAVIHDIAESLASRLADVGRATVPGAGHMAPMTHPAEVAGLIAVNLDRA